MNLGIKNKVAVVTGAGQGIGLETALALAAEGAHICVNDINSKQGEQAVAQIRKLGVQAMFQQGDVSDETQVKFLFSAAKEHLGPVEILVNNAAYSPKVPFDEVSAEQFEQVMKVNLLGSFLCAQQAFFQMKEAGWGRIVNLSSMAGRFGANKAGVHYSATKAGIIGLTLTLAKKMGPYNITVNCVAPGRINTALTQILPKDVIDQIVSQIPMGRLGDPSEVADVITYLASEKASYVTGACVDILGGYIA